MKESGWAYTLAVLLLVGVPSFLFSFVFLRGFAPYYAYGLSFGLTGAAFFLCRQIAGGRSYLSFALKAPFVVVLAAAVDVGSSLAIVEWWSSASYFANWSTIPQSSYLVLLMAMLVIYFFPGYFIIYLLRADRKLGLLGTVVMSFVVSYFVDNLLSAYLVVHEGGFAGSYLGVGVVNVGLAVVALFYSVFFDRRPLKLEIDDAALSFLSILSTFVFLFFAVDYAGDIPFLKGDLFTLFGEALRYLQPGWMAATNVTYPQGFFWNLALLLNETSFPYMNAAVLTIGLVLFLPAAVSFSAYAVSKDKGVSLFATLAVALFGPLFWVLYFDYTNVYSLANPNLSIPFYTWDFKDTTAGIICTIPLLGLAFGKLGLSWWSKASLMAAALSAAVLAHVVEPVIAVGAFLPVVLFSPSRPFGEKVVTGGAMLGGLVVSVLLGRSVGMGSVVVGGAVLAAVSGVTLLAAAVSKIPPIQRRITHPLASSVMRLSRARVVLAVAIIYLYGLSLLAFVAFPLTNMNLAVWTYGIVPVGFWWLVLGIPVLVVLAGYLMGLFERSPGWVASMVAAALMSLVVVVGFGFLNTQTTITVSSTLSGSGVPTAVPTGILAWRLLIILFVPLALLFGIVSQRFGGTMARGGVRKYVLPIFVISIILLGVPSSVVEARGLIGNQGAIQASAFKFTVPELNATTFMTSKLPLNSVVLTLTLRGSELVSAGERNVRALANLSAPALGAIISATHDPALVLSLLRYYNVSYIFVDQFDYAQELSTPVYGAGTGYLVQSLLPFLPIVFNDTGNVIYSVPRFYGAAPPGGAGLVVPFSQPSSFSTVATLLGTASAYSELGYGQSPGNASVAVMPNDPLPSLQAGDSSWYRVETVGDSLSNTTSSVGWKVNATDIVPHTLVVGLSQYYALSQTQSMTFQTLASGPSLSCGVNSTGAVNQLLASFAPSNRTITLQVPTAVAAGMTGLQFTCTPPPGSNGTSLFSFGPMSFSVPADSQAASYVSAYPQQANLSNYISWVESGGKLLVVDPGLPLGFFAHFMGLEESGSLNVTGTSAGGAPIPGTATFNSTVADALSYGSATPLAWYSAQNVTDASPFLLSEKVGSGTIYWIQMGPLLHELNSFALTLSQASSAFGEAFAAVAPVSDNGLPAAFLAILSGQDTLQGKMQVSGDYFVPSLNGVGLSLVSGSSLLFKNFTLNAVYGTGITWSATATSADLVTSTVPGLVKFTFGQGVNITVGPPAGGQVVLNGVYSSAPINITLSAPVVLSTGANVSMMVHSPKVTLFGSVTSTRTYVTNQFLPQIPFPPYGGSFFRSGGEFAAQGVISMSMTSYKESVVLTNMSGSWNPVDPNPAGTWTISNAGWVNLLISQGDVVIVVALVVLLLVRPVILVTAKRIMGESVPEGAEPS